MWLSGSPKSIRHLSVWWPYAVLMPTARISWKFWETLWWTKQRPNQHHWFLLGRKRSLRSYKRRPPEGTDKMLDTLQRVEILKKRLETVYRVWTTISWSQIWFIINKTFRQTSEHHKVWKYRWRQLTGPKKAATMARMETRADRISLVLWKRRVTRISEAFSKPLLATSSFHSLWSLQNTHNQIMYTKNCLAFNFDKSASFLWLIFKVQISAATLMVRHVPSRPTLGFCLFLLIFLIKPFLCSSLCIISFIWGFFPTCLFTPFVNKMHHPLKC